MDPDCYGLDHGDSAVVCHRETDLVYSEGGVGVKNADPRLGGSFSELAHMGYDYTVGVRASGAVEEHCFSSEDFCRCPGKLRHRRHVVFDIDDLVGPDDGPCAIPDCHRHIIRTSTCKRVNGRVASPVYPITESPCEGVGCSSTARRGIQSNRVSSCWAGGAESEDCSGRLGYRSKNGAC